METNVPITYIKDFVKEPNLVFAKLWNELSWLRIDTVPRREYYCNEVPVDYTYGRGRGVRTYNPQEWHPTILELKALVEAEANTKFEVCFLNGYEDQSDQLGWHADDSPEMDDERPIAIISLGVEREIWFRESPEKQKAIRLNQDLISGRQTENQVNDQLEAMQNRITKLKLNNGSLCLMKPGMQDTHQHRIPKAGFICGSRVSLTFRGYARV